jgi:Ca2+-binding RTX toxin-like protein
MRRSRRWLPFLMLAVIVTVSSTAQTGANTVTSTKADNDSRTIGVNDLKPTECAALVLTTLLTGSGTISGGNANELIIGSAGVDTINGGGGDDCILGGGGNDAIQGGGGIDVCVGGPGTDTFSNNCETQIQ